MFRSSARIARWVRKRCCRYSQELTESRRSPRQRHAQRRPSQARRRPHRLSKIFAGIFRALRARSRRARRPYSRRLLRHHARAHSRYGRSRQIAASCKIPRRRITPSRSSPKPAPVLQRDPESKFWKKLQKKEFTVCVEIDPPKGLSLDRIFEQVDKIMASGKVDAIDINSGAMARVGMDALIVAGALEARGVETVPHLTTRDFNIIGLQAVLARRVDRRRRAQRPGHHRRSALRRRLPGNQRRLRSGFRRPRQSL